MIKAIFYKEWIKTRWVAISAAIISLGFVWYSCARIEKAILIKGAPYIWEALLTHDIVLIELLCYMPLFVGLVLALAQYVPEMQQKRLKLTLHLPVETLTIAGSMVLYGLIVLLFIVALNFVVLAIYLQKFFAAELVSRILLTALPWYAAGLAAYGLTAWTCLEPVWKRRLLHVFVAAFLLRLFFLIPNPEAYNGSLWWILPLSVLFPGWALLSIKRFKEGKQD